LSLVADSPSIIQERAAAVEAREVLRHDHDHRQNDTDSRDVLIQRVSAQWGFFRAFV
jgi:hypothetical protein